MPAGPGIGLSTIPTTRQPGCAPIQAGDALADRAVNRRVAHDAALADLLAAGLELRLDQRDQLGPLGGQRQRRRQHRRQADEAGIAGDQVDRLRDFARASDSAR